MTIVLPLVVDRGVSQRRSCLFLWNSTTDGRTDFDVDTIPVTSFRRPTVSSDTVRPESLSMRTVVLQIRSRLVTYTQLVCPSPLSKDPSFFV